MNLYDSIKRCLDPDEHVVFPSDYVDNWQLYDEITGVGYLVRNLDPAGEDLSYDFVFGRDGLARWAEDRDEAFLEVVDKLLICRVRMPWSEVNTEWIASEEDLENHRDEWEILETYIRVIPADTTTPANGSKLLLSPSDRRAFEAHPERYKVVKRSYLVAWKMSPESRERLLEI